MSRNRVIGRNNTLPWRMPADLQHFRHLTTGHHIIMGRKNHEDIGKPLPGRTNIVLTQQTGYAAPGCLVVHSLQEALMAAKADNEVFVIGGAMIYSQTLDLADRLYITEIDADVDGDTLFPEFDRSSWTETSREEHPADEKNPYAYRFITLERNTPAGRA